MQQSKQGAAALIPLTIMIDYMSFKAGKPYKGSPGLIYDLAQQEAFKRAAFDVDNAQRAQVGDRLKQPEINSFKSDKLAEWNYLLAQANKSSE